MKYKLLAVDMDGTLLTDKKEVSQGNADAIKKAMEAGAIFSISTGRPIQGIEKYIKQLNLTGPMITYNGAMIVDAQSHEPLFQQNLSKEDAKRILEAGNKFGTTMVIWANNQLYGNVLNDRMAKYSKAVNVEALLLDDVDKILEHGATKILWYDEIENISSFEEQLKEKNDFEEVTFCTSQPIYLEFFSSKVSKAVAMEKIGELFDIKQEEMIAAGDGYNDLAMIEYAGLGVAMDNAPDEIKTYAQYVTSSNEEDGIAKVIEEFILK